MANSPERDLARAKQFRAMAKDAQDSEAKQTFLETANRLERRAAKKASKVGRKRRKNAPVRV